MKPLDKNDKRLAVALYLAACIIVGALIGYARAATIERTAPAGTKIDVGIETVATVATQPITVIVTPQTQPTTRTAPPPDVVTAPLIPPAGVRVLRLTSGVGSITMQSNTWYVSSSSGTATLKGSTGLRIPGGTVNSAVVGINFEGTDSTGKGIDAVWSTPIQNITIADCTFKNFGAGGRFHHKDLDNAPASGWSKNVKLLRVRFINTTATDQKGGQGLYVQNVDGFQQIECFIDGVGRHKAYRQVWTHGDYNQHGNRNVRFDSCFINDCEAVGIQARGPLNVYTDADNGTDPGPSVTNCVVANTPIGIMLNGPRAVARDNIVIVGPHTVAHDQGSNTGGECGIYASVGRFRSTNNLVVSGPVTGSGTRLPAFQNSKRSDAPWGWNADCNYVENTGNKDRRDVRIDVSDLAQRGRGGESVLSLLAEARRRAHAAGVN